MTSLFELLPAVHRLRDAAIAGTIPAEQGPLEAFLAAIAEQVAVLDESIEQLYDDQFIETCAPWVTPYIGDLIGYRPLHGRAPGLGSRRAEVAHTIALRRRKGTASVLEQLARDVTGWDARVVEFFELLATTQYMNHRRLGNRVAPSLRDAAAMDAIGTAFDASPARSTCAGSRAGAAGTTCRTSGSSCGASAPTGLSAHRRRRRRRDRPAAASASAHSAPTACSTPAPRPRTRSRIWPSRSTSRRRSTAARSPVIWIATTAPAAASKSTSTQIPSRRPASRSATCATTAPAGRTTRPPAGSRSTPSSAGSSWRPTSRRPPGSTSPTTTARRARSAAAPTRARTASSRRPAPTCASRRITLRSRLRSTRSAAPASSRSPTTGATPRRSPSTWPRTARFELRAAPGRRPTLELGAPFNVRGADGSAFVLNGLLVAGNGLIVPAATGLRRLRIAHCTLVPGRSVDADLLPVEVGQPSVQVRPLGTRLEVERSITGPLRVRDGASAAVTDAIVDASTLNRHAYGSTQGGTAEPGGALTLEATTVIGRLACEALTASNSLLLGAVRVVRRQEGCVRFSFVAPGSATPRRYRCTTAEFPRLASLRYGTPAYCQLTARTPDAIRRGADDESEMGAFHFLYAPQRESDLRTRLDEYLRVGLEAGIFYES